MTNKKEVSINYAPRRFHEHDLHKAIKYLGYSTGSQTKDIVELIMFAVNNNANGEQILEKAKRIWKRENVD